MIEIAVLFFGTRHLAKVARDRGHSGWFGALLPALWIGAEMMGVMAGLVAFDDVLAGVMLGLVGAAVGGIIAAITVYSLPNRALADDTVAYADGVESGAVRDNVWAG